MGIISNNGSEFKGDFGLTILIDIESSVSVSPGTNKLNSIVERVVILMLSVTQQVAMEQAHLQFPKLRFPEDYMWRRKEKTSGPKG